MKIVRSVLLPFLSLYFISCGTQQRMPNYLQNATDTTVRESVQIQELRIQKNDLLSIQVFSSSTNPLTDALYNLPATQGVSTQPGFLVDANGNINFPKLGTFHAEGMTKNELAAEIRKRLTEPIKLLEEPVVLIRFLQLKITVIGEVNNQGVVSIPGEKITILEAIGLAGGITDFGIKNAVKVMRETDGKRQIGMVDLSSGDLFESPYYNLQQNDVVLVEPTKRKAKNADQAVVTQRVGFALTIVTALGLLYSIFK